MRRGDLLCGLVLGGVLVLLAVPASQGWILASTRSHPYAMGFLKFAILASIGDLLSIRVVTGRWRAPSGPVYRAVVWGLIGAALAVLFPVFAAGVGSAGAGGLLPAAGGATGGRLASALWISAIMNLTWAPTLMLYHRVTDTYLDLAGGRLSSLGAVRLERVVGAIDWRGFVGFVLFKTVPLFWIPAHTITFLLPPELRVLFAALLSVSLGAILGFSKRRGAGTAIRAA